MSHYKAERITKENFAPYGVYVGNSIGADMPGDGVCYQGKIATLTMPSNLSAGYLHVKGDVKTTPTLERHFNTPEMLTVLEGDALMVCGLPKNGISEITGLKAFYIKQGDVFCMAEGNWHYAPVPYGCEIAKFMVLFREGTEDQDMDVVNLDEEIEISL